MISQTNCASQFQLFLTFLFVALPVVCTPDKSTTEQPGNSCGWSGRLEQSPTGHSNPHLYIINFQKHAQDISLLTFLLH